MQVRSLKTKDIFPMSRILKKIGLKDVIREAAANMAANAKSANKPEDKRSAAASAQMKLGADIVATLFENLYLAEEETNAFLADLVGMKPEEFAELELTDTLGIIDQLKGSKVFASFLKQASQ